MFSSMRSSQFSSSLHAANACCSRDGAAVGFAPSPLPSGRTSPDGVSKSYSIRYKVSLLCLSTFMSFRLFCAVSDFGTFGNLIHPALYAISVRTVGISPRTSSSTVRYLPAVVLQVWDSASSRLLADFHRSAHIASVAPKKGRVRQNPAFQGKYQSAISSGGK